MGQVRFISDYHFGHEFCAKLRGFKDANEMNEHIIKMHNKVTHKRDLTYILGDLTCNNKKFIPLLQRMKGRKVLIGGNHDEWKHTQLILKYVEGIAGIIKYKGIFLSHCPIHPQELEYRVKYNIHGHLHAHDVKKEIITNSRDTSTGSKDDRYINVSCEQINYTPRTLVELGINR